MIKSGQTWAGTFNTLDSTGALAAATGTPTGTLYVDGTSNAATVTITGSNPYKWSVTLPTLTAGQRVDLYITATIGSVETGAVVASEQADTALVSEVKTDTAAILADTGTDGVVLTAAAVDAVLDEVVVGTYTMRQLLAVMASALAGKVSGGGTSTITFRGVDDTSDVIVATVDTNGNRSAVTLTV